MFGSQDFPPTVEGTVVFDRWFDTFEEALTFVRNAPEEAADYLLRLQKVAAVTEQEFFSALKPCRTSSQWSHGDHQSVQGRKPQQTSESPTATQFRTRAKSWSQKIPVKKDENELHGTTNDVSLARQRSEAKQEVGVAPSCKTEEDRPKMEVLPASNNPATKIEHFYPCDISAASVLNGSKMTTASFSADIANEHDECDELPFSHVTKVNVKRELSCGKNVGLSPTKNEPVHNSPCSDVANQPDPAGKLVGRPSTPKTEPVHVDGSNTVYNPSQSQTPFLHVDSDDSSDVVILSCKNRKARGKSKAKELQVASVFKKERLLSKHSPVLDLDPATINTAKNSIGGSRKLADIPSDGQLDQNANMRCANFSLSEHETEPQGTVAPSKSSLGHLNSMKKGHRKETRTRQLTDSERCRQVETSDSDIDLKLGIKFQDRAVQRHTKHAAAPPGYRHSEASIDIVTGAQFDLGTQGSSFSPSDSRFPSQSSPVLSLVAEPTDFACFSTKDEALKPESQTVDLTQDYEDSQVKLAHDGGVVFDFTALSDDEEEISPVRKRRRLVPLKLQSPPRKEQKRKNQKRNASQRQRKSQSVVIDRKISSPECSSNSDIGDFIVPDSDVDEECIVDDNFMEEGVRPLFPHIMPTDHRISQIVDAHAHAQDSILALSSNQELFNLYVKGHILTFIDSSFRDALIGNGQHPETRGMVSSLKLAIRRVEEDIFRSRASEFVADGRWRDVQTALDYRPFIVFFRRKLNILPHPVNSRNEVADYCNGCCYRVHSARYHKPDGTLVLHGPSLRLSSMKHWPLSLTFNDEGVPLLPGDLTPEFLNVKALQRKFQNRMAQRRDRRFVTDDSDEASAVEPATDDDSDGARSEHGSDPVGFHFGQSCLKRCIVYHRMLWIRYEIARRVRCRVIQVLETELVDVDVSRDFILDVMLGEPDKCANELTRKYAILPELRRMANYLLSGEGLLKKSTLF